MDRTAPEPGRNASPSMAIMPSRRARPRRRSSSRVERKARRLRRVEKGRQSVGTIIVGVPAVLPRELGVGEEPPAIAWLLEIKGQPREHAILLGEVRHVEHDDRGEAVPAIDRERGVLGRSPDSPSIAAGRRCRSREFVEPGECGPGRGLVRRVWEGRRPQAQRISKAGRYDRIRSLVKYPKERKVTRRWQGS